MSSGLTDEERLNLSKMIKNYDADDNTAKIRKLCHSKKIKESIETLINLKRKYVRMKRDTPKKFEKLAISHCNFLFTHYTNIFNRILKDEIDFNILMAFITKLRDIESGKVDQHEASVSIGKILKRLYVDSAIKREDKLNSIDEKTGKKKKEKKPKHNISWQKFKEMNQ